MSSTETLGKINSLLAELSYDELMIVAKSCVVRANKSVKFELMIGDNVYFQSKTGAVRSGVLIKKNPKTFHVLVGNITWKVSPTMLKKVA